MFQKGLAKIWILTIVVVIIIVASILLGGILIRQQWQKSVEEQLPLVEEELTREQIITYVTENITVISPRELEFGAIDWSVIGYGFTPDMHMYVDFEDGHFLWRALLACTGTPLNIECDVEALFEPQREGAWPLVEGQDTQKDEPIVHQWTIDYRWTR